jgi:hypothetical protein
MSIVIAPHKDHIWRPNRRRSGALNAALEAGFSCGGWCPEAREAEDGPIPERYPVTVLPGAGYRQRIREPIEGYRDSRGLRGLLLLEYVKKFLEGIPFGTGRS